MATNSFLPFSQDPTANVLTDAAYVSAGQRTIGNQPGIASAQLNNKALRQATTLVAGIAQFLANRQAVNLSDALTPTQIENILNSVLGINRHSFIATSSAPQAITAAGTLMLFPVVQLDTDSEFDPGTSRFTPKKAGWYSITSQVSITKPSEGQSAFINLAKNISPGKSGPVGVSMVGASVFAAAISSLVYFNGTTDYITVTIWPSVVADTYPGGNSCIFQGFLVHAD